MTAFTPQPFHLVDTPEQLKAFTDPLRIRLLVVLSEHAATNQQLADALAEPQAKVLYHLRFLLRTGLIRLVDTQIKGGNVEKYYRAIARTFDLRLSPDLRSAVSSAEFAVVAQEVAASAARWPDEPQRFVIRGRRIAPAEAVAFYDRLLAFLDTYWDDPHAESAGAAPPTPSDPEQDAPLFYCAAVVFRTARAADAPQEPPADPPRP